MRLSKLQGINIMDDTFRCSDIDRQIIDKQEDQVVIHWEVATSSPISPHYTHINCNARLAQKKGGGGGEQRKQKESFNRECRVIAANVLWKVIVSCGGCEKFIGRVREGQV